MNLTDLLQTAGYPTDVCTIDFETYFDVDYNLKKMSTSEYVFDERFQILGAAVKINRTPAVFVPYSDLVTSPHLHTQNCTIINHNSFFDALVAYTLGIQWPYILDTMALARHVDPRRRNSLKALSLAYNLPAKGDTLQFRGLKEPTEALAKYACRDADNTYQLAEILAPFITNPRRELWLMGHTLDLFLAPVVRVNYKRAERIKALMDRKLSHTLKKANTTLEEVRGPKKLSACLTALGVKVPQKMGKYGLIPAFAKTDHGYLGLKNDSNPKVREIIAAREAAKTWPTQIKRIDQLVNQTKARGNRLPVALKYYGAATGRWAGAGKTNLQNLSVRGEDRLRNQIRSIICAPPVHRLVVVDAAQIEARGLVWIAGQEDALETYRNGVDRYRLLAAQVYQCAPDGVTLKQRIVGKVLILGAGYGMGADRLVEYAKTTFKIQMTRTEAAAYIHAYRTQNPEVVRFWKTIENAFKFVIAYRTPKELADGRLRVAWVPGQDIIALRLPSGRALYYHSPRMYKDVKDYSRLMADHCPKLWGGLLTENIVQAISRDILGEAIYTLEQEGLHVVLHVHDEVVMVVPTAQVETVLARAIEVFSISPPWAKGWPLGAEGKIMEGYGK